LLNVSKTVKNIRFKNLSALPNNGYNVEKKGTIKGRELCAKPIASKLSSNFDSKLWNYILEMLS